MVNLMIMHSINPTSLNEIYLEAQKVLVKETRKYKDTGLISEIELVFTSNKIAGKVAVELAKVTHWPVSVNATKHSIVLKVATLAGINLIKI